MEIICKNHTFNQLH